MRRRLLLLYSLAFSAILNAQFTISGTITDENNKPLPGASIHITGTTSGAVSNSQGVYELTNIQPGNQNISVSFLGYNTVTKEFNLTKNETFDFNLKPDIITSEEIIVLATRAGNATPATFTEVSEEDIKSKNLGQDIPYLLGMEPSLVYASDAGAGIGYTGLWIRGSNIQRINVTVNGIPLNDPESHGVFWVNMPDFASSVESAQIQRGVGTSTNGGGAFGATINLETSHVEKEAFGEINSSYGSFNTFKNNARFSTGIIKDKWAFEGRASKITSDGYIDRASSDLSSVFFQGGYYTDQTTVKAVFFTGKEKTYQAWWGVDDWTIENLGRTYNWAGVIYNDDGTERYYDNQTDNYQQDHYQLHLAQKMSKNISLNASLHYTYGRGYYEEYYQDANLSWFPVGIQFFGFDSTFNGSSYDYFYHDTIGTSDVIARRWLNNHFYGGTFGLNYKKGMFDITIGGALNKYGNAKHFGEIIWAQYTGDVNIRDKYYDNVSDKTDFNVFGKLSLKPNTNLSIFVDLQERIVDYAGTGTDNDGSQIDINGYYSFFNPKFGVTYNTGIAGQIYGSVAIANREPVRTDFLDAPDSVKPKAEELIDFEAGLRKQYAGHYFNINAYYMKYSNQLVLTGEINDVGSFIRKNVGESYRMGIEIDGATTLTNWFKFRGNISLGTSGTDYKAQIDTLIVEHDNVLLSFSPQVIAGSEAVFEPVKNLELIASAKYVSQQYLDLTEQKARSLDPYGLINFRLIYRLQPKFVEEIRFSLMLNNVFNLNYSANGYVWNGTPYYYPQAGRNWLGGISVKF